MSAKNVKTLRAAHESWNKRDFAGLVSNAVKGLAYTDHGRNITLNTRDKFREWTEGWAKAFSDGRITNSVKSVISTRKGGWFRAVATTINTHS